MVVVVAEGDGSWFVLVHFLVNIFEAGVEQLLQSQGLPFFCLQGTNLIHQFIRRLSCLCILQLVMSALREQTVLEQVPNERNHDLLCFFVQQFTQNPQESLRYVVRLRVESGLGAAMLLEQFDHRLGQNELVQLKLLVKVRVVLEHLQNVGI